ncbi:MAG: hypothetical protein JO257_35800, partial [Deltaproteobacteria bacterium]|nr:hypothetical protein [Deltaproteobacteria bacterium]
MRRLALLLALAAACRSTPSRLDQRTASTGSATADPWKPAAGSSLDIPAWAHDSPTVLRDKINAVNAHVVVLKATDMPEYHRVLESTEHTAGVIAAEPFLFVEGTVALGSGAPLPTAVKGIDPARAERVLAIAKHLQTGSLASLGLDDAIVGDDLVHQLGAKLG